VNLAVINLIPIPALDGGRLLFVLIERVIRRDIPEVYANALNTVGFLAIIALMIVVTYNDIFKLVTG
jgi:regulator of sigma E protease